MYFEACRAGLRLSLTRFCLARQLHNLITASRSCQQLFYTFLRKFSEAVYKAACIKFFGTKKWNEPFCRSRRFISSFWAEKEGFEPSRRFSRPTPFPGEPLRPLGYFSKKIPTNVVYVIYTTQRSVFSGEDGIRTHVPVRTNGFQDRLVMTASIPLQIVVLKKLLSIFVFQYRPIQPLMFVRQLRSCS